MKYLYVTTISETVNMFLIPHIKMLIEQGNTVDIACHVERPIDDELVELGCQVYDLPFSRSITGNNYFQLNKTIRTLVEEKAYDIIHTHTPLASAITRFAVRKNPGVKIVYTAHGFHFFKGASLLNWLIYYPIERYLTRYTDVLITINQEDYQRAQTFSHCVVELVPGVGFNLKKDKDPTNKCHPYRDKFNLKEDQIALLSVGELNDNKNHLTVIQALTKFKEGNFKYFICGDGDKKESLQQFIEEQSLEDKVVLVGYRKDIAQMMDMSDIFIFPSYREGLSVALMEAMASGLPVICSDIRGNRDLIDEGQGGVLFDPHDIEKLKDAIKELVSDAQKRKDYGQYNRQKVQNYSLDIVLEKLANIYKKIAF